MWTDYVSCFASSESIRKRESQGSTLALSHSVTIQCRRKAVVWNPRVSVQKVSGRKRKNARNGITGCEDVARMGVEQKNPKQEYCIPYLHKG